jgi:hypothetical protein
MKEKVFCIGLGKTGTTSLAKALEYMGFHVGRRQVVFKKHLPNVELIDSVKTGRYDEIFKILPFFDAFVDNPWPLLYKELASRESQAKFILTTREEGSWLKSVLTYFGNSHSEFRKLVYGESSPKGNETLYLNRYQKHNQEVIEYFASSSNRLLVLPLEERGKWQLLANFLGTTRPNMDYPITNKTNKNQHKAIVSRLSKAFNLNYLEVLLTLVYARILTLLFPFKQVAKKMAKPSRTISPQNDESKLLGRAVKFSQIVKSLSKKVPFRAMCFEQALSMQLLLKRRGLTSEIYFGVNTKKDKLSAHAWCVYNDVTLTGEKSKEEFVVLKRFSNQSNVRLKKS